MVRYTETMARQILTRNYGGRTTGIILETAKREGAVHIGGLRVGFATGKGYGPDGSYSIS